MTVELTFSIAQTPQSVVVEFDEKGQLVAFRPNFFELPEAAQRLEAGEKSEAIGDQLRRLREPLRIALGLLKSSKIRRSASWPAALQPLRRAVVGFFLNKKGATNSPDHWIRTLEEAQFFDQKSPAAALFPLKKVLAALFETDEKAAEAVLFLWLKHRENEVVWTALAATFGRDIGLDPDAIGQRIGSSGLAFLVEKATSETDQKAFFAAIRAIAAADHLPDAPAAFAHIWLKAAFDRAEPDTVALFLSRDWPAVEAAMLVDFHFLSEKAQLMIVDWATLFQKTAFLKPLFFNWQQLLPAVAARIAWQLPRLAVDEKIEKTLWAMRDAGIEIGFDPLRWAAGKYSAARALEMIETEQDSWQIRLLLGIVAVGKPSGAVQNLLKKMDCPEYQTSWDALADALGELPDGREGLPFLKKIAASGNEQLLRASLLALKKLDPAEAERLAIASVLDVRSRPQRPDDFQILAHSTSEKAVESLQKALEIGGKLPLALLALVENCSPAACDALFKATKNGRFRRPDKRLLAIGLARTGDARAVELLLESLEMGPQKPRSDSLAFVAAARLGGSMVGPELTRLVKSPNWRGHFQPDFLEALAEAGEAEMVAKMFREQPETFGSPFEGPRPVAFALALAGGPCGPLLDQKMRGLTQSIGSAGWLFLLKKDPKWLFFQIEAMQTDSRWFKPGEDWSLATPAFCKGLIFDVLKPFWPQKLAHFLACVADFNPALARWLHDELIEHGIRCKQEVPPAHTARWIDFEPPIRWHGPPIFGQESALNDLRRWAADRLAGRTSDQKITARLRRIEQNLLRT